LRIWIELESNIKQRRETFGPRDYMKNLEELKNKVQNYASKNNPRDLEQLRKLKAKE